MTPRMDCHRDPARCTVLAAGKEIPMLFEASQLKVTLGDRHIAV